MTTDNLVRRLQSIPGIINIYADAIEYLDGSGRVTKRLIIRINELPVTEKIDDACRKVLSIDYNIRVGRFTKPHPTVSDYLRKKD